MASSDLDFIAIFVNVELENEAIRWDSSLTYALLVPLIVAVLGLGIEIWKTFKDRDSSKAEHNSIKEHEDKNKESLTADHELIRSELSSKHEDLKSGQTSISQTASEIRTTVSSIDKQLAVEQARREAMLESMTARQHDIHSQIDAIYALNQQIPKLEYEKQQLTKKLESLQHQYTDLERKHENLLKDYQQLQQREQEVQHEPDEDEDLTQSIDN